MAAGVSSRVKSELVKMLALLMAPLGRQQRSQGDQNLSCWCCQCHSALLLARCFRNAGPRLHLCQLLGKKACCMPWADIHSQAGAGGGLMVTEPGRRAQGAAKLPRKQVIPPTLLPWLITLPVCPALPPQAPFPRGRPQVVNLAIGAPGALCQVFTLVH